MYVCRSFYEKLCGCWGVKIQELVMSVCTDARMQCMYSNYNHSIIYLRISLFTDLLSFFRVPVSRWEGLGCKVVGGMGRVGRDVSGRLG